MVLSLPLVLGTCRLGDLTGTPDEPVLEVVLAGTIVGVADTATLSATVLVNGAETDSVPLQWTSSDSAIAVVDSTGMVRGRARGTAVITAEIIGGSVTSDSAGDSDSVWVVAASLELAPDDTTLTAAEDTLCLRHLARDANGAPLLDTSPTYSVEDDPDSTIALSAGGCVVSRTSGRTATVLGSLDTVTATADVTVHQTVTALVVEPDSAELLAIGATVQLDAEAQDRNGNPVPVNLINWTSNDESVAAVDTVGEVTATGSGSAWIHAVADQLEDSAYIDVNPPPVREDRECGERLADLDGDNERQLMACPLEDLRRRLRGHAGQHPRDPDAPSLRSASGPGHVPRHAGHRAPRRQRQPG